MNQLADANSLYLRQHADNPVDWYPWGPAALERARQEDKPILLSIGYSACHWCHVMAHESFEDPATAAVMNEHFINIKVDREERPDLDRIYQLAHQALSRRAGGWPLTVFLDPESHLPFFAGTYFPPRPRHGMPAFRDLLARIAEFFSEHRDQLEEQNASMASFLEDVAKASSPGETPDLDALDSAVELLQSHYDDVNGGFGGAPKFPHPPNLELLSAVRSVPAASAHKAAKRMWDTTLRAMGSGGLFDQLGGGFFRYCVDADWTIPHFEKMLYDNAQLLPLYARHGSETGDGTSRRIAKLTVGWLEREMMSSEGLFYSSLDADSNGAEGRYYVWQRDELRSLLSPVQWQAVEGVHGLDGPPNFENHAWHLVARRTVSETAAMLEKGEAEVRAELVTAQEAMREERAKRSRPGRDEKILVSWNALMIAGLVRSGRLLGQTAWIDHAENALDRLVERAWRGQRLLAVLASDLVGYLDDYAFLLGATIDVLEARWSDARLDFAEALADALLEQFEDSKSGGFFFTAADHEPLIQRPRSFMDDSLPAGNGVAARSLCRLGHLLAESRYLDAAERVFAAAAQDLRRAPHACGTLLVALAEWRAPPPQVIVRGAAQDLAPGTRVFVIPDGSRLADRYPRHGAFTAYVCEGMQCGEPVTDPAKLLDALEGG